MNPIESQVEDMMKIELMVEVCTLPSCRPWRWRQCLTEVSNNIILRLQPLFVVNKHFVYLDYCIILCG